MSIEESTVFKAVELINKELSKAYDNKSKRMTHDLLLAIYNGFNVSVTYRDEMIWYGENDDINLKSMVQSMARSLKNNFILDKTAYKVVKELLND